MEIITVEDKQIKISNPYFTHFTFIHTRPYANELTLPQWY